MTAWILGANFELHSLSGSSYHHLLCQVQVFLPSILQLREGSTIVTSVETILHFLPLEFVEEVEEYLLGVMEG
jgi:hypothetical protein